MLRAIFAIILLFSVGLCNKPRQSQLIINEQMLGIADTDERTDIDPSLIYQNIDPVELSLSSKNVEKSVYIYQPFSLKLVANTDKVLDFDMELTIHSNDITLVWS